MKAPLPFFIAARYVFSRQEQRFISFVSLVSWLGLILGVAAMILVLSVMNGFDRELRQRILRVIPHGTVEWQGKAAPPPWESLVRQVTFFPGIEGIAPLMSGKALVALGDSTLALELQGILPEEERQVSDIADSMLVGELAALKAGEFGIVLGHQLARRLHVTTGDQVRVMLPEVNISAAGAFPRQKLFRVVGVFRVGAEPDGQLALIHLYTAARLFRQWHDDKSPRVTQWRIKTKDIHRADRILGDLSRQLQPLGFSVRSWEDDHRLLFNAIRMERRVIALLLFAVIAVAVFNIASILVMMVAEKRKDIAILRVMGAETSQVMKIFVCQGLLIGILGIGVGILAGSLLAIFLEPLLKGLEALSSSAWFNGDVFYITHLPSDYRVGDVSLVAVVSLLLCLVAALYPAWQASRIDPVLSLNE